MTSTATHLTPREFDAQMPDGSRLLSHNFDMESSLHYMQLLLLVTCLEWFWRDGQRPAPEGYHQDYFIGANLTIYFSRQQLKSEDSRGPDFFLVKNVEKRPRTSWVVWEEEGRYPDLIIELLSDSTAKNDRGLEKTLYQDRFKTTEYFWFSPDSLEFEGFRLGQRGYETIVPNAQGWSWSQELGLYLGVHDSKLRYFQPNGELVPTLEEDATQQYEVARQEAQRAEQVTAQLRQVVQRLSQQGLEQEEISELTGLTIAQIEDYLG